MPNSVPRVFISYSHDSNEHKSWVLGLATRLMANSVDVILDQWDLGLGGNLPAFMERGLSSSDRVLAICTPEYVRKANEGKGGVGYEKMILTAALIKDANDDSVIPVVRSAGSAGLVPTFLGSKVYVDFRNDALFESGYGELIRFLHGEAVRPRPPLGSNPFKQIEVAIDPVVSFGSERYVSPAMEGVVAFDFSNNNGCFTFGAGDMAFETAWSNAGNNLIHAYTDRPSIRSVALVTSGREISEIQDATAFDSSSRCRTPRTGEILVWKNTAGYYLATKILSVRVRIPEQLFDVVRIQYKIAPLKSPRFSESAI